MTDTDTNPGKAEPETLRAAVARISGHLAARDEITAEIKAEYDSLKRAGFVPRHVRAVVREHRMDADERAEAYATLDAYRETLGLFADTPLGEATVAREAHETTSRPRPFADQPVHRTHSVSAPVNRRGRPRKQTGDILIFEGPVEPDSYAPSGHNGQDSEPEPPAAA